MVVVAHGVVIREVFRVRCVSLLHVVKLHGGSTFVGRDLAGSIVFAEVRRLGFSVVIRADGHFRPRKEVTQATAGIRRGGMTDIAIELLVHLEETVHRAVGVGIVGKGRVIGDLEGARRQRGVRRGLGNTRNAAVWNVTRQSCATRQQILVVVKGVRRQSVLRGARIANVADAVVCANIGGTAVERCGFEGVRGLTAGGGQLKRGEPGYVSVVLDRVGAVRARSAIGIDDAFRQKIVHGFARHRRIGREQMVERPVLTHDDDHVFDGRGRRGAHGTGGYGAAYGLVFGLGVLHQRAKETLRERNQC